MSIAAPVVALLLPIFAGGHATARAAGVSPAADDAGERLSRIEQAIWDRDPKAVPLLRDWAAGDPVDRVRERSIGALAIVGDAASAPLFLGRLADDPSPAVRRAAAEAVGLLGTEASVRHLTERLRKDTDPFVRAECARAIGRIGDTRSGPDLVVSLVGDPSPEVRALAAEALAAIRPPEASDMLGAAARQDGSILVRTYAIRALAAGFPASSASLFAAVWESAGDPDLRLEAFRGLTRAGKGEAWEQAGLADDDERVRFLAFSHWLSRSRASRAANRAPSDGEFASSLEGFLGDRARGIRELARTELESLGVRVRPYGFGYAVER